MNYEKLKADLLYKADLEEVAKGNRSGLEDGLRNAPVKQMIDAANYIENNLLPAVKKKNGEKSADYIFFKEVVDYLAWAILLSDRYGQMEMRWIRQKLEIQLLKEHLELLERELQRYTTLEDVLLSSTLDVYAARVKAAVADRLKNKK
jgi:hypothetical protein